MMLLIKNGRNNPSSLICYYTLKSFLFLCRILKKVKQETEAILEDDRIAGLK